MPLEAIRVHLGPRSYDIQVTSGGLSQLVPWLQGWYEGRRAFVVTDANVSQHAEAVGAALGQGGFRVATYVLRPGEAEKTLANAERLYDFLAGHEADRRSLLVAVGGGVVGDLGGFVAGTFARGLPLLMVPTSLLAMVDSAVGGKTGVNHPRGKNLIGVFHQPGGVWIDTQFLRTLPEREYRSAFAEVVKYGVIRDPALFRYLEDQVPALLERCDEQLREIICRSCRLKAEIVEQDERETSGLRAILNFGHTFAHAFETVAGYGTWLHGEAVAAGMVCATRLAVQLGLIEAAFCQRLARLLERFGLPTRPEPWPVEALLRTMRSDKKAVAGMPRFVLPRKLGQVELMGGVPEDEVRRTLESLMHERMPAQMP
jgi:3-dehydroquinate synthase